MTDEELDALVKLTEEFVNATWHLLDNSEMSGPKDDPIITVWQPDFDEVGALLDRCEGLPSGSTEYMAAGELLAANMTAAITTLRARVAEVQGWFEHEQEMHQITMGERDHALAALDEAKEETKDAISTLEAWFDRRELGHKAVDQAVLDAASGYLRTSRSGGMPQKKSDLVLAVFQDMARLGVFADLFARAAKTQVEAERAAQIEVDAAIADDYVEMRERSISTEKAKAAHHIDVPQLMRWWAGKVQSQNIADAIRAKPHSPTALDRVKVEVRADAIREVLAWHEREASGAMNSLHCGSENGEYRAANRLHDFHKSSVVGISAALLDKEGE